MAEESPKANEIAYRRAANRLHHLSMRYAGAVMELVVNEKIGMIPNNQPGLREMRDMVDLILFTRAEINALTALLVKKGVFTAEEFSKQAAEEYEHFAQVKAAFLGVGLTDHGITFSNPGPPPHPG